MGRQKTVMLVDATGRGHAIAECLVRTDPDVVVYYVPGSPFITLDRVHVVGAVGVGDAGALAALAHDLCPDLVLVSHIDALKNGAVDALRALGIRVVGPTLAASRLETSKSYCKGFLDRHNIPTASGSGGLSAAEAMQEVASARYPLMVKADGLCDRGDGSIACADVSEAHAAIRRLSDRSLYGDVAGRMIVEERLEGVEMSLFALADGSRATAFSTALDYKRAFDGDRGPNCDGMGSVSPHPFESGSLMERLRDAIVEPFTRGLRDDGLAYDGFVYFGLMLTSDGPKVLEVNVRFGDSEAQAVFPRLTSSLFSLLDAASRGTLRDERATFSADAHVSVALVQGPASPDQGPGWPVTPARSGQTIFGLDGLDEAEGRIYFAGMAVGGCGRPITSGARVAHAVGAGATYEGARRKAYGMASRLHFEGKRVRTDIGAGLVGPR